MVGCAQWSKLPPIPRLRECRIWPARHTLTGRRTIAVDAANVADAAHDREMRRSNGRAPDQARARNSFTPRPSLRRNKVRKVTPSA